MIIIYLLFTLIVLNYIVFLILILIGIRTSKKIIDTNSNVYPVSIIIPFRNESENIDKLFKSLSAINYPESKYEIILIDDHSTDNSDLKIKQYLKQNIKLIKNDFVKNGFKKSAIEKAIKYASHDFIILTDADCLHSNDWLKSMMSGFEHNNMAMIVGPVRFRNSKSVFDKFQQLEFAGLMLTAAGLIGIHKPKICSSANLAFRKNVFENINGYRDNKHLSSGDDELLLQKISKLSNQRIKFCWNKDAVVETQSNKNVRNFFQQRRRWASKSLFYESKIFITFLVFVFMFYLLLIISPFLSFFYKPVIYFFISAVILKFIVEFFIMKEGKNILYEKSNLKYFLAVEIVQTPYIIISAILGIKGNYSWKNREVKR